ncbi:hypothetical protein LINPERHAP2_LOCUS5635 [Linum perenne]
MAMVKVNRCWSGSPVPSYALIAGGTNPCGGGMLRRFLSRGCLMASCFGPDWWRGRNSRYISSESAMPVASPPDEPSA